MEAVESFVANMDFIAFEQDLKTKSAVLAQLSLMGEAAKMVPPAFRAENPGVAWKNMAGMRDRLIHGYFRVDYALVWHSIKHVLPVEKCIIEEIVAALAKPISE
jgi:uncharacterized protein with HEPN domain